MPAAFSFLTGTGRLEKNFSFRLLDAAAQGYADGAVLELDWDSTSQALVLWTQPGKPFVCVEPWSDLALPLGGVTSTLRAGERVRYRLGLRLR